MVLKPDKLEKGIRFGCGAVLGLLVGVYVGIDYFLIENEMVAFIATVVCIALVCGILAMKQGDRFWETIKSWWW
jgi:uncharacterized protein YacL